MSQPLKREDITAFEAAQPVLPHIGANNGSLHANVFLGFKSAPSGLSGGDISEKRILKREYTLQKIIERLDKVHALMIKSPPMSGKTCLAVLIAYYVTDFHRAKGLKSEDITAFEAAQPVLPHIGANNGSLHANVFLGFKSAPSGLSGGYISEKRILKREYTLQKIIERLDKVHALMIKSPPMSGKTCLAVLIANYVTDFHRAKGLK
ncbi:hypothetical protein MP638_003471, partial [Amoeboaphelidium occidentale]